MAWGGTHHIGHIIAFAVVALTTGNAAAQEAQGGLNAGLSFSQGLSVTSDDGTFLSSGLNGTLSSVTRTQALQLTFGTTLEQRFDSGLDFELTDPNLGLTYTQESRQTQLTAAFNYRGSDADALSVSDDPTSTELVFDSGQRTDLNSELTFAFGREALFGGDVSLGYAGTRYSDTTAESLVDEDQISTAVNLRFEINQRLTATVGLNASELQRDGGRDVETYGLNTGLTYAATPTLEGRISVGRSKVTTTDEGITIREEGLNYALSVTQTRPTGTLSYALTSDISETGRRTTGRINAAFETRRGNISGGIGLTQGDGSDLRPLYELSYADELPRWSYSIALNQGFSVNGEGEEILNSRVQLNVAQALTAATEFNTSIGYQDSNNLDGGTDTTRLDVSVGAQHTLANDWAANARYQRSRISTSGQSDDVSDDLFVGLTKSIGWRP